MEPGGDDESYEYVDEKEVDLRENEDKGKDDGDRLVGGKISSTRFTQNIRREKSYQGVSFRGGLEPARKPRPGGLQW